MKTYKYLLVIMLLTACSESVVEVEHEPLTVEGSWSGSFTDPNFIRSGIPRTDTFEIELIQRPDNTVEGAGMWEQWYGDDFDRRSYVSVQGVFVAPNLSVNGGTFWGLITLRGELDGDVLHLTKNGRSQLDMYRLHEDADQ
jgi:hypothetical protein